MSSPELAAASLDGTAHWDSETIADLGGELCWPLVLDLT